MKNRAGIPCICPAPLIRRRPANLLRRFLQVLQNLGSPHYQNVCADLLETEEETPGTSRSLLIGVFSGDAVSVVLMLSLFLFGLIEAL